MRYSDRSRWVGDNTAGASSRNECGENAPDIYDLADQIDSDTFFALLRATGEHAGEDEPATSVDAASTAAAERAIARVKFWEQVGVPIDLLTHIESISVPLTSQAFAAADRSMVILPKDSSLPLPAFRERESATTIYADSEGDLYVNFRDVESPIAASCGVLPSGRFDEFLLLKNLGRGDLEEALSLI